MAAIKVLSQIKQRLLADKQVHVEQSGGQDLKALYHSPYYTFSS